MGTGSTSSDRKAARSAGASDSAAGGASESGMGMGMGMEMGSGPGGAVDPANGGIIRAVSIHSPCFCMALYSTPPPPQTLLVSWFGWARLIPTRFYAVENTKNTRTHISYILGGAVELIWLA